MKVHPDGTGALKKTDRKPSESRGGWTTKIHLVAANARTAITFASRRAKLTTLRGQACKRRSAMPRLTCDRQSLRGKQDPTTGSTDMVPVVPPKSNRIEPWEYDRASTRNAMK